MASDLSAGILDVLNRQPGHALFLSELRAGVSGTSAEVEHAVEALDGDRLLVVNPHSPDPHLTGDFRIVALAAPEDPERARRAAGLVWSRWLREVLAHHRCG